MNKSNQGSDKVILFTSSYDDEGAFRSAFAGVDEPFWKEFHLYECVYLFTRVDDGERPTYSAYDPVLVDFDLLVIWEPRPDEAVDIMRQYANTLENLGSQMTRENRRFHNNGLYVALHASAEASCKKAQTRFIESIGDQFSHVRVTEYSHMQGDPVYENVGEVLRAAVRGGVSKRDYRRLFSRIIDEWPARVLDLPILTALFLFFDSLAGQLSFADAKKKSDVFNTFFEALSQHNGGGWHCDLERELRMLVRDPESYVDAIDQVMKSKTGNAEKVVFLRSKLYPLLKAAHEL